MIAVPAPTDNPEVARQRVADALVAAGISEAHLAAALTAVGMLEKAQYLRGRREALKGPSEHD